MPHGTDERWTVGYVNETETAPSQSHGEKYAKFMSKRDRALATIVLSVQPSLLYLLGDPEDPVAVFNGPVPEENMGK